MAFPGHVTLVFKLGPVRLRTLSWKGPVFRTGHFTFTQLPTLAWILVPSVYFSQAHRLFETSSVHMAPRMA